MARYYCKNCDTIIELNDDLDLYGYIKICPRCKNPTDEYFVKIPDYETPAQYEKRTGEAYPDSGAVWITHDHRKDWHLIMYDTAKACVNLQPSFKFYIVIASPPVPPPDGFAPEGAG